MIPLLSADRLCLKNPAGQILFESLTLSVYPGQIWALLGENGVGKSCLLRTLAGLDHEEGHPVHILNHALDEKPATLAKLRAYLPQQVRYPVDQTVFETLINARYPHQPFWPIGVQNEDKLFVLTISRQFDIDTWLNRRLSTLSGGQLQRVALAAAWTQQTPLLFLDEPTTFLDLPHQHHLLAFMARQCQSENRSILVSLQDPNLALQYCSHALLLFQDGHYLSGPIEEMLTADRLSTLYRHPVKKILDNAHAYFVAETCIN